MTDPQLWVSAIELGCFFGLLALSYFVVLAGTGFFNFAVGPYAMVGGLCTAWLVINHGFGLWFAVVIALVVTMALAATTELVVVRPVQRRSGRSDLPALVAVTAVLFAIEQLAGVVFGYTTLPGENLVNIQPVQLGSAIVVPSALVLAIVTVVVFVLVAAWVRFTRTGRLLRAVGDSREAATLLGLPVNRIRIVAFVLSGLLAGIAGLLFAPKAGVSSTSGLDWALSGFLALVVGGTATVWAPLVGGLILGALQIFIPFYFGGASLSYLLLILAVAFFALRPQGIFVRRVRV
jgi:branched-chain amino acid transport system permease protein